MIIFFAFDEDKFVYVFDLIFTTCMWHELYITNNKFIGSSTLIRSKKKPAKLRINWLTSNHDAPWKWNQINIFMYKINQRPEKTQSQLSPTKNGKLTFQTQTTFIMHYLAAHQTLWSWFSPPPKSKPLHLNIIQNFDTHCPDQIWLHFFPQLSLLRIYYSFI